MRLPRIKNIFKKTFVRTKVFMDEATFAFFVAAGVVAFFQVAGLLDTIILFFEPLITKVLLLPKEVALSFILGMIRRDFGAFGLLEIPLTPAQIVTSCLVLTLFVPCIATLAVMIKERNFKSAFSIWLASWILAFGFGALFARYVSIFLG
jgi:ferrous iron transport protein B